jgi:hypothetical protein
MLALRIHLTRGSINSIVVSSCGIHVAELAADTLKLNPTQS